MAGHQLIHALVEGFFANRVAIEKILLEHALVQLFRQTRISDDLVDIAGTEQLAVNRGIEQLLLPYLIADHEQLTCRIIPYRDRESAVQVFRQGDLPLLIRFLQDRFFAFFAAERRFDPQLFTQTLPVADITAEIADLDRIVFHIRPSMSKYVKIIPFLSDIVNYLLRDFRYGIRQFLHYFFK